MMLFLTIPTAGSRSSELQRLIERSGVARECIVIIATRRHLDLPPGCIVVEDLGPINIQRWWNRGILEAQERGATSVAVLNDDVALGDGALQEMEKELHGSSAVVASPLREEFGPGIHRGRLVPYAPVLWGACWMVKTSSALRPDERYRWWYGDNDLDIRARSYFGGVMSVDVAFEHLHSGQTLSLSPELQALTEGDTQLFENEYRLLLKRSRRIQRWQQRLGKRGVKDARRG